MAGQAEARHVGARANDSLRKARHDRRGRPVQLHHDLDRSCQVLWGSRPGTPCLRQNAGAEGLCENKPVTWACSRIGQKTCQVNFSSDCVAELPFLVANGVTTKQDNARLTQLVESAQKDGANDVLS